MLDDDRSEDSTPKAGKKSKMTQHTFVLDLPFKKLLRENESQSPEPRARKISDQSDEMKKRRFESINSDDSHGPFELGERSFNIDHKVKLWVRDYIKRQKMQKELIEMFINPNSFNTNVVYSLKVEES